MRARPGLLTDSELPHLSQILDTAAMPGYFESYFDRVYEGTAPHVEGCSIEKVYYRQAKRCSVLYRLYLRGRDGKDRDHWFYARMFPQGYGRKRYFKAAASAPEALDLWKPVSYWHEMDTVLYAFPHDRSMPQLYELTRPGTIESIVEQNAEKLGLPAGTKCRKVTTRSVKYMPEKRCVLRFDIEVSTPSAQSDTFSFYSKTYPDEGSKYVFSFLEDASALEQAGITKIEIPRPLLYLDRYYTYWQEVWDGDAVSDVFRPSSSDGLLDHIAEALAEFHRSRLTGLHATVDVQDVLRDSEEDVAEICQFDPYDQAALVDCGRTLKEVFATLKGKEPPPIVPLHGAFRLSQLLCKGDRIAMVDFDGVACGDPHSDVAEFMASLLYRHFTDDLPLSELQRCGNRFRERYSGMVPWEVDPDRISWYMAAFMLEKLHGTFKGMQTAVFGKLDELFELVQELGRKAQAD